MAFKIEVTPTANEQLNALERDSGLAKRLKAVRKALALLENNPRHPGLNSHKYSSLSTKQYDVFEAYAENNTPAAFRIFWRNGPAEKTITVLSITQQP